MCGSASAVPRVAAATLGADAGGRAPLASSLFTSRTPRSPARVAHLQVFRAFIHSSFCCHPPLVLLSSVRFVCPLLFHPPPLRPSPPTMPPPSLLSSSFVSPLTRRQPPGQAQWPLPEPGRLFLVALSLFRFWSLVMALQSTGLGRGPPGFVPAPASTAAPGPSSAAPPAAAAAASTPALPILPVFRTFLHHRFCCHPRRSKSRGDRYKKNPRAQN